MSNRKYELINEEEANALLKAFFDPNGTLPNDEIIVVKDEPVELAPKTKIKEYPFEALAYFDPDKFKANPSKPTFLLSIFKPAKKRKVTAQQKRRAFNKSMGQL